jgi:hypothetical protein
MINFGVKNQNDKYLKIEYFHKNSCDSNGASTRLERAIDLLPPFLQRINAASTNHLSQLQAV